MEIAADEIIRAEGIYKSFGDAVHALNGCDLSIRRGEVVAIIGPSGSGKSTMLRCMNLLEVPTRGRILFEGVELTDRRTNINLYRQRMGP